MWLENLGRIFLGCESWEGRWSWGVEIMVGFDWGDEIYFIVSSLY